MPASSSRRTAAAIAPQRLLIGDTHCAVDQRGPAVADCRERRGCFGAASRILDPNLEHFATDTCFELAQHIGGERGRACVFRWGKPQFRSRLKRGLKVLGADMFLTRAGLLTNRLLQDELG